MRFLLALLLFQSLTYRSCSDKNREDGNVNLQFTFSYPVSYSKTGKNANLFSFQDTVTIFSSGDYWIMRLPYQTLEFTSGRGIPRTEDYFVFKEGQENGLYFKNISDTLCIKMQVDSILKASKTKINGFEPLTDTIYKLTGKGSLPDGKVYEQYTAVNKINPTLFDSIYYYFDPKLNNINYSFSPSLDSLRKMKLCKARLIYAPSYSEKDHVTLPTREFSFAMTPTSEKISDAMLRLLQRCKREKL